VAEPDAVPLLSDGSALQELWQILSELTEWPADASDPANRDVDFIRRIMPLARGIEAFADTYFRPEFHGVEHLPDEQYLAVGNHSGSPLIPDVIVMIAWWATHRGLEPPAYVLAHDVLFRIPVLRALLTKIGVMPAHQRNADAALRTGASVMCYPGGELDCQRTYWDRHRVRLFGRSGFVKLALRYGVPIVPFVNAGGGEVYVTLYSSRALARWTGLEALTRVKSIPVTLGLPWGMWLSGFVPYLPLPAKLTYRFGEPIRLPHDPKLAEDERAVRGYYEQVVAVMQDMLDDLARQRRFPIIG
jgi:1-acyl-sn-glycerol-3-phosphate acyltransferase